MVTVAVTAVARAGQPEAGWALAVAAGGMVGVSVATQRALSARLGGVTATAAVSVLWSVVLAALALLSPECPGASRVDAGPCTPRQTAVWALVGLVSPMAVAVAVLPLRAAVWWVRRRVTEGRGAE